MPKSAQTIETVLQESDGGTLLTNNDMDLEDLIWVALEGAAIKVDNDDVGHLMDAIKMHHSNWKGYPKYKKCLILESIVSMPTFQGKLDALLEYLGCGKDPVTTTQAPPGSTTPGCVKLDAAGGGTCGSTPDCCPCKCIRMFCYFELLFCMPILYLTLYLYPVF